MPTGTWLCSTQGNSIKHKSLLLKCDISWLATEKTLKATIDFTKSTSRLLSPPERLSERRKKGISVFGVVS